jgi:hypothetical protein
MIADTIAGLDAEIINARWRWWHGAWSRNVIQVECAKAAIDALLDRRYELMQQVAADCGGAEATQSTEVTQSTRSLVA